MTEGISKKDLQERLEINLKNYAEDDPVIDTIKWIIANCTELDPWLPIGLSDVDNKEYLFITKNKKQRVDRFHPSQYATVNTDLRWQERPGDRYTHYKLLPGDPK